MASASSFRSYFPDIDRARYQPRLQLELTLRAGIGLILCKPQWWLKWRGIAMDGTSSDPTVADKWLREVVTAVLKNRFYWMTKYWSVRLPRAEVMKAIHSRSITELFRRAKYSEFLRPTLDDLIDRYDLMNPASAKTFISPGPVMETWMSDSIVPADVKAKFVREVSVLEDVPDEQKDWHPGSNDQVLDLVHPSLYCCVYDNPTYPGGSWHIEGAETESIVATGIYYFGCENITESKLSFRVIVEPPSYIHNDDIGMASLFGLQNGKGLVQRLGAATAMEDRCIVFPNTFQHRVEPFELADPSRPGVRKTLAFFLVDPSKKVLSTSVIPPQQTEWLREAYRVALHGVRDLPEVVVDGPLCDFLDQGMSLETARQHRDRLMLERGPFDVEAYGDLAFNLCEH
ncbi:hypothetical protein ATCC90586_010359 [Pythium insidiosum]|nr:hypothetical protein ATCC90586_010359 [Pythium insidiosum]